MTVPTAAFPTDPPRVLYVSTVDIVVRMMLPHLDALRAAGFQVEIACRTTRHRAEMEAHCDILHEIPFERSPVHPRNVAALQKLAALMRARKYTVVHAHTPVGGLAGRLAATLAGVPVRIYTAHGFHFHRHGGRISNLLYRGIETVAGRLWSDGVMVINQEDYDTALRAGVVAKDRLFLTGGVGISLDRFDPAAVPDADRAAVRREIGAPDDDTPVLTMIGEMIPRKRHPDLLAAFARIRGELPNARLVLVGEGVRMAEVQETARRLGVSDACTFLGYRRDIPAILAATDLFAFPSGQEGLPCSIQEALAMQAPVVTTDTRGCRDLVDAECGAVVPLGDVDAFAAAAVKLLRRSRVERREMGRRGRARMLAEYERGACVRQWLGIYAELLRRRGLSMPAGLPSEARIADSGGPSAIDL